MSWVIYIFRIIVAGTTIFAVYMTWQNDKRYRYFITDDSIIIDPSSMSIFKEFTKQDSLVSIDKDFYQFPETQITLAKSSIHYVQKSNYFRYLCYGFTYISISSALIIAPLVGINYKAGGFNSNRYGQVVKYSLLAAASGIAVSFFFPERTYRFSPGEL